MAKSKVKKGGQIFSTDPEIQQFEHVDLSRPVVLPSYRARCLGHVRSPVCGCFAPTSDDDLIHGVKSLSDQIRSFRAGGLPLGQRELSDSNYDEDDSVDIDPSIEPGLDRFERQVAITDRISERMRKKHKEKLEKAEV